MARLPGSVPALLISVIAATPVVSQSVVTPTVIHRAPPFLTPWGAAKRLASVDFTNEALKSVFTLHSTGIVSYCYGPSIMSTTFRQVLPGGQLDMAPLTNRWGNGVLVTDGTTLKKITFGGVTTPFALTPLQAPPGFPGVKLETFEQGGVTYVASLAADLRTIRIGTLATSTITMLGSLITASDVKQLAFYNYDATGAPELAVRTATGLQVHRTDASSVTQFTAPNYLPDNGCIARARNGAGTADRLSWLRYDSVATRWHLQTHVGNAVTQDLSINFIAPFPLRSGIIGITTEALDQDGFDDVFLQQTANEYHATLPGTATGYSTRYTAIQIPDTVPALDTCPALLTDLDSDGVTDLLLYQDHIPALGVVLSLGLYAGGTVAPPVDVLDPLGGTTFGTDWSNASSGLGYFSLRLGVRIPTQYQNTPNSTDPYRLQMVVWHQNVTQPDPAIPYAWESVIPAAESNTIFSYGLAAKPIMMLKLKGPHWSYQDGPTGATAPEPSGNWIDHSYILYRFVKTAPNSTNVVWASPSIMVGFNGNVVAAAGMGVLSGYMSTISSATGKPPINFENKNIGTIKKPDQLDLPWLAGSTPAFGPVTSQVTTTATW